MLKNGEFYCFHTSEITCWQIWEVDGCAPIITYLRQKVVKSLLLEEYLGYSLVFWHVQKLTHFDAFLAKKEIFLFFKMRTSRHLLIVFTRFSFFLFCFLLFWLLVWLLFILFYLFLLHILVFVVFRGILDCFFLLFGILLLILLQIFLWWSSFLYIDMFTPAVLMVPDMTRLALGNVLLICSIILTVAERLLIPLLITKHSHKWTLRI